MTADIMNSALWDVCPNILRYLQLVTLPRYLCVAYSVKERWLSKSLVATLLHTTLNFV